MATSANNTMSSNLGAHKGLTIAILGVGIGLTRIVVQRRRRQRRYRDMECRKQAAKFALKRQVEAAKVTINVRPKKSQKPKKRRSNMEQGTTKLIKQENSKVELTRSRRTKKKKKKDEDKDEGNTWYNNNSASYNTSGALPIFDDGRTVFRHLIHLPGEEKIASTLKRIQEEFLPIIRYHRYDVKLVTEMCCCGDGIDYELGGHRRRVQRFQRINGLDQEYCGGYNRTCYAARASRSPGLIGSNWGRKSIHTIHLRMRDPHNHCTLLPYDMVKETMAHEISHCVHQNHSKPFWDLMYDILKEHVILVKVKNETGKIPSKYYSGSGNDDHNDNKPDSKQFGGFNIYGSSTSRLHVT